MGDIRLPEDVILPNGDGGSAGGDVGSGGDSSTPINLTNLPVTGGLAGFQQELLVPGFDNLTNSFILYKIDTNDFNCEEDVEYHFRLEEVVQGNDITIHNVLIRYRDLGIITFKMYITSTDESKSIVKSVTMGSVLATGRLFTKRVDINTTMEAPQLRIIRLANSGQLAITKVIAEASYGTGDVI